MKTKTDREKSLKADEFVWDTTSNTEVHAFVRPVLNKWIPANKRIKLLDLGCGNGVLTSQLATGAIECTGTDHSKTGIIIAQNNFPYVEFFQSNIEQNLPSVHFKEYDLVISIEVIEHLLLPRELFSRAKEALKPGGSLIISTPFHGYWKNLALALTNNFDAHWHPLRDYGHIKFFSLNTIKELFREEGFEVEAVELVGRIPVFARSMIIKGKLIS